MITSVALDDGTSTFSARFAAVIASREHRVLLVDILSPRQLGDGALSLDEMLSAKDRTGLFSDHAELIAAADDQINFCWDQRRRLYQNRRLLSKL